MSNYNKIIRNGLSFLSGCSDIEINWNFIRVDSYNRELGLRTIFEREGISAITRFLHFVDSEYTFFNIRVDNREGTVPYTHSWNYNVHFTISFFNRDGQHDTIVVDRTFHYDLQNWSEDKLYSEAVLEYIISMAEEEYSTAFISLDGENDELSINEKVSNMVYEEAIENLESQIKSLKNSLSKVDNDSSSEIEDELDEGTETDSQNSEDTLTVEEFVALLEIVNNINNSSESDEVDEEAVFIDSGEIEEDATGDTIEEIEGDEIIEEEDEIVEETEQDEDPVEEGIIEEGGDSEDDNGTDYEESTDNIDSESNNSDTMNPYVKKSRFNKKHVTKDIKEKSSSIQYFINKNEKIEPDLSVSVRKDVERLGDLEISNKVPSPYQQDVSNFNYTGLSEELLDEIMENIKDELKFNYYELIIAHFVESYVLGFGNNLNHLLQKTSQQEGGKYRRVYMEQIWEYVNDGVTPMISVAQSDLSQERSDEIYTKALSLFMGKDKGANIIPAVVKFLYEYYFKPIFIDDPEFDPDKFPSIVTTFLQNIRESAKGSGNKIIELYGDLTKQAHTSVIDYLKDNMSIILESVPYSDDLYEEFETKVADILEDFKNSYVINGNSKDIVGDLCETLMFNNKHIKILGSNNVEEIRDLIEEYVFTLYPAMVALMEKSVPNADFNLFSQYMYYSFCFTDEERAELRETLSSEEREGAIMDVIKNRIISSILIYCIQANYLKFFTHNYTGDIDEDIREYYQFIYGFTIFFMNIQPYMKSEDDINTYYEVAQSRIENLDRGDIFPASSTEFLVMSTLYNKKKVPIPYVKMFKTAFVTAMEKFREGRDS